MEIKAMGMVGLLIYIVGSMAFLLALAFDVGTDRPIEQKRRLEIWAFSFIFGGMALLILFAVTA